MQIDEPRTAPEPTCDSCGGALGDYVYERSGLDLCESCFRESLNEIPARELAMLVGARAIYRR